MARGALVACTAAVLFAAMMSAPAFGAAHRLQPPAINHVAAPITLPKQWGTLSRPVLKWLRSEGITALIAPLPRGYPPVKGLTAARVATAHTPVGPHPVIRQLAVVALDTAIPPLRVHRIYWAVVLSARGSARRANFVAFASATKPTSIGYLRHPRRANSGGSLPRLSTDAR